MLTEVLTGVTVVVGILLVITLPIAVGWRRLVTAVREAPVRIYESWPVIAVILAVLLANRVVRQQFPDGIVRLSGVFYAIEADFMLWVTSLVHEELIIYFSFVYVYGYVFLLVFPVLAYFALERAGPFQKLLVAYTLNYTIGPLIYLLVLAYGPRNMLVEIETVLYDFGPEYQHLTREVNRNTNVFPSLHTSLSVTIAIFAYQTRDRYPGWFVVAGLLGASVAVSTVYLAIHWVMDVVAGIVLAAISVAVAHHVVDDRQFVDRSRRAAVDWWRDSTVGIELREWWDGSSLATALRDRFRR